MLKDRLDAAYDYDDEATPEAKDLNKEVTTALDELNHAVMADRIVARARPSHSPTTPNEHWPRIPIPANTIDERRRIGVSGWCQIRTDAPFDEWRGDPGPFFYDVCFKAGDVKRLWKPPSKRPPKPPIPWADLLKWWRFEYLKKHSDPDKRPTVAEQHEAAKAQFPNHAPPTFEQMKKLRAHPGTPGEWSEGGRRPKSG